jgi:HAD superfamily hydrolase (TIGR01509 family)
MVKGAIYDFDDLMVNSYPLHILSWDLVLEKYNHKIEEIPEAIRRQFVGKRVIDIAQEVVGFFNLELPAKELDKVRTEIFLGLIKNRLALMPGLIESLQFFKKHNYKIAVASSARREYINVVLNKYSLGGYYDAVVSADDVSQGKPSPEIFLAAVEKLSLPTTDCVVLEDANNGVVAAKAAGCKCIAVISPYTPKQDLSRADVIIHSLVEINDQILNGLKSVL